MNFLNMSKINDLLGIAVLNVKHCFTEGAVKHGATVISEKYSNFVSHVSSGSANSIITIGVIMLGIFIVLTTVSRHGVDVAHAQVETQKIQLEITRERADAQRDIMKYQVRIEETRAAANPYVVAANNIVPPVNVYIDAGNLNYVIETSDGATEIAISTIKVKGIRYSSEQRKLMTIAFHVGKEVGFPETIQSFLLQETLAGAFGDRIGDTNLSIGKRSYGVMQIKVATARKVLKSNRKLIPKYFPSRKTYKRLRDEEIIIKLIQDDEFSIRLGALNFAMHRKQSRSWAQAVVAYNTGQWGANKIKNPKEHIYYGYILKRLIKEVRPFNKKTSLTL